MYDIIPTTPTTDVSVKVSTIEENSPSNKIKPLQWSPERLQSAIQDKARGYSSAMNLQLLIFCNTDWSY